MFGRGQASCLWPIKVSTTGGAAFLRCLSRLQILKKPGADGMAVVREFEYEHFKKHINSRYKGVSPWSCPKLSRAMKHRDMFAT